MSDDFKTLDSGELLDVSGGLNMPSSGRWIMQHEAGGNLEARVWGLRPCS